MSTAVAFDISSCDLPTIRWGKHAKNTEISRIFNDLFSFELPDEAWHDLFINTTTNVGGNINITQAVVPIDIVARVRTAIGVHILLPVATDTPGDEASMLLAYNGKSRGLFLSSSLRPFELGAHSMKLCSWCRSWVLIT